MGLEQQRLVLFPVQREQRLDCEWQQRFCRQQQLVQLEPGCSPRELWLYEMELETLKDDYYGCRSNKRRSLDSIHFSLHWERDLMRLLRDFEDRSLVPFLYGFINPNPRDREVIACLMEMKTLQYHFDYHVRPHVEERLTDSTFNNRIGFGCDRAILKVRDDIRKVSKNYTRDCYIIKRDIKSYFPSTDLDRSYESYRALIEECIEDKDEKDDLLYILQRVNYAYPQEHARLRSPRFRWDDIIAAGKSVIFNNDPKHGACLGNQFWQVEKNYALAEFDRFQVSTCGLHYTRFVDDMVWVVENLQAGLAHVATSEKMLLEEFGYQMHPRKRYQQHYSKGVTFLGAKIKFNRIYASDRAVRNCKMAIRKWNRLVYPSMLGHFLDSINSYLGNFKHKNAYGIIRDLVDEVSPKWEKYCHYNDDRRCFEANEGYKHNDILKRKYHFKFNKDKRSKNDKTRNRGQKERPVLPHFGQGGEA